MNLFGGAGGAAGGRNAGPSTYDFRKTDKFTSDQARFLQRILQNFVENIVTKLSPLLSSRIQLELVSTKIMSYGEYVTSLADPTPIILMSIGDGAKAFIDIDFDLSLSIFERLMGGRGHVYNDNFRPYFTEVEQEVLRRPYSMLVDAFAESWTDVESISAVMEKIETNPSNVYICNPSDSVVVAQCQMEVVRTQGVLGVCIPFSFLRDTIPKRSFDEFVASTNVKIESTEESLMFPESIHKAKVPVSVGLGSSSVAFQDLLTLEAGDIIRLDREVNEPLKVKVNAKTKFLGQPGVKDGKMAIKVIRVLDEGDEEYDE